MDWPILLGGAALGLAMTAKNRGKQRQITFEVTTRVPLPVGEQVFVAGSGPVLGDWSPDGLPLTRTDDKVWSGSEFFPEDAAIEYKITRGTWNSEEALEDGATPGNRFVEPGGDRLLQHQVAGWKDMGAGHMPQITGNYRVHEGFHSSFLRFDRRVIVWLPPSYGRGGRSYPVLYMQDGQQVFDPRTSTWGQDWQVDEWCTKLIEDKEMREIIVVAAHSTEDRFVEYNPSLAGREYARFVTEELKPFIDREYRTQPGRNTTAIAGSSMGAAIAFHLAWTRPDLFFGAACLSPAFRFRNDSSTLDRVRATSSPPDLRVYLYCGLGDPTEVELAEGMYEMANLLKARGFTRGRNLVVKEDPAGQHNEASWAKHTGDWLKFLFSK